MDRRSESTKTGSELIPASGGPPNFPPVGPVSSLPKLDGKNFQSWKELVELVLTLRGLVKAVKKDDVDETSNLQAKLILLESMDESHRSQVRGCMTAKEIMNRLDLIYADNSAANIYRMLHRYYRYTKISSDSMSVHIGKMDEMRNALSDIGEKQSDADLYGDPYRISANGVQRDDGALGTYASGNAHNSKPGQSSDKKGRRSEAESRHRSGSTDETGKKNVNQ